MLLGFALDSVSSKETRAQILWAWVSHAITLAAEETSKDGGINAGLDSMFSEIQHSKFRDIFLQCGYFRPLSPAKLEQFSLLLEENIKEGQPFLIGNDFL